MKKSILMTSLLIILAVSLPARAEWGGGGTVICGAEDWQRYPWTVSDGAGGAIIAWQDARGGSWDIYAQRVDGDGNVYWTEDGVAVCTERGDQLRPRMAPDGEGGAIITWFDYRAGSLFSIFAQRISADGEPLWETGGVAILPTETGEAERPEIIPDGTGGAVIAWFDGRNGELDIYAQRVSASGSILWGRYGTAVCTAAGDQKRPFPVSDGEGGAIIVWLDRRKGDWGVYAQRLGTNGEAMWSDDGIAVSTGPGGKAGARIAPDGEGGAILIWADSKSGQDRYPAPGRRREGAVGRKRHLRMQGFQAPDEAGYSFRRGGRRLRDLGGRQKRQAGHIHPASGRRRRRRLER